MRSVYRTRPVRQMAFDPWNNLYVADGYPDQGAITVYSPGAASRIRVIHIYPIVAMALDARGALFAAWPNLLQVYAPLSNRVVRVVRQGITETEAMTIDRSGKAYVANANYVSVFPPNAARPSRRIRAGVYSAWAVAVSSNGHLFVANCPSCYGSGGDDSVTEYSPNASAPIRTLTGIDGPHAIAVAPNGDLYVANYVGPKRGSVAVFGPHGGRPIRTITKGVDGPSALVLDGDGTLYVANCHACADEKGPDTVTVYGDGGTRMVRTISGPIVDPYSLAIGGP